METLFGMGQPGDADGHSSDSDVRDPVAAGLAMASVRAIKVANAKTFKECSLHIRDRRPRHVFAQRS